MFQGGLRIYTTLQGPKQAMAANAVQGQMDQFRGDPAGALASVEPSTGRIVALYGGRSFKKSQVDLATAQGGTGFQPGSAFKMFFVVAALEKGISPGLVMPGPAQITIPNRRCYTGTTALDPRERRRLQRRDLQHVRGRGQLGEHLVRPARGEGRPRAGGRGGPQDGHHQHPAPRQQGLRLLERLLAGAGGQEVSVLDMAGAFGVLANKGVRCAPYSITKVVAPGERKPLIENKPDCKQVIDEKISTRTVAMLRGVITGGTGGRASLGARPVAGKTGSAQNNTSAFFSGFTPQLSTSVWVGYRARRVPMRNLFNGGPVYGGTFPAIIFHNYMEAALAGQPVVGFPAAPPPPAPPEVGVPDVVGLPQETAQAVLAQAGFGSRSGRSAAPSPRAGWSARRPARHPPAPGQHRVLAVSGGRGGGGGNVIVPGVVGLQAGVARTLLARAGLSSGLAYTNSGQPGRVAAQSPGAGQPSLPRGSYVTLVVAGRRS